MYARVTRVQTKTDEIDEVDRTAEEKVLPDLEKDPGFKGVYVLGDRQSGDTLIITMWETQEAEEASREKVRERLGIMKDHFAGPPEPSVTYEVISSMVPAAPPVA